MRDGVTATDIHLDPGARAEETPNSVYDFNVLQYEKEISLAQFKDQVTVILNIASEWPLQVTAMSTSSTSLQHVTAVILASINFQLSCLTKHDIQLPT